MYVYRYIDYSTSDSHMYIFLRRTKMNQEWDIMDIVGQSKVQTVVMRVALQLLLTIGMNPATLLRRSQHILRTQGGNGLVLMVVILW